MLKHVIRADDWSDKNLAQKGFTLIELLVVIIILGVLAAVVIFAVGTTKENAEEATCKTELATLTTAVAAWKANPNLPANGISIAELMDPQDPDGAGPRDENDSEAFLKTTPKFYDVSSAGVPSLTTAGTNAECALSYP